MIRREVDCYVGRWEGEEDRWGRAEDEDHVNWESNDHANLVHRLAGAGRDKG